jgi:predicted molibdopterin-dependent oxidoreductase YjgC
MPKINLTINGHAVTADQGLTVLEAAQAAGIYIPALCHHPDLKPYGGCRVCLVEIEGMRGLTTSCTTQAAGGMVVRTDSPAVEEARRLAVELLIAEHPLDCLTCASNGRCELQTVAAYLGITQIRLPRRVRSYPVDDSNPFFNLDRNKCILCARCTRTCAEVTGVSAIDMANRGYAMKVTTAGDRLLMESSCQSCGECVAHCPTGALSLKSCLPPSEQIKTTCTYCGVGCGMLLGTRAGKIVSVQGNPAGTNNGWLCVKGRFGIAEYVHSPERLTVPLIRKNGRLEKAGWDEALELIAANLKKYSPAELAVIPSSRTSNEDVYVAQKFGRAVLGTNHIDNCARV